MAETENPEGAADGKNNAENELRPELKLAKPKEPFDWMKFLKLHPLVVAGSLIISGATGGVAGYLAFGSFIETKVGTALEAQKDKFKGNRGEPAIFPIGAVLAFDRKEGCPIEFGWTPHTDSYGRVIVGAIPTGNGKPAEMTHEVKEHRNYFHSETHGDERVTLNVENMPMHTHTTETGLAKDGTQDIQFRATGQDSGGREVVWKNDHVETELPSARYLRLPNGNHNHPVVVNPTGNGVAHNNMPPYIALYFCKKG